MCLDQQFKLNKMVKKVHIDFDNFLVVLDTGFEPVTSSMSWKHSTTELIEHVS